MEDVGSSRQSRDRRRRQIDKSQKISDNPFDVLSKELYREDRENNENRAGAKTSLLKDNVFESLLTKSKTEAAEIRKASPYGICTGMALLATKEIELAPKKMYKFPFNLETRSDGSLLFKSLYSEYLIALRAVFREHRKNHLEFYLKFGSDFLHFGTRLEISKGMKKILAANEIRFEENDSLLVVEGMEVVLVFDYIINVSLGPSFAIPFILSESPFDNSVLFFVKLRRESIVKRGAELLYSYRLAGPLWISSYSELIIHVNKIL